MFSCSHPSRDRGCPASSAQDDFGEVPLLVYVDTTNPYLDRGLDAALHLQQAYRLGRVTNCPSTHRKFGGRLDAMCQRLQHGVENVEESIDKRDTFDSHP
jgi:hypothetical protein